MTQCMSWSIGLANNYIIPKFSHSYLLLSCFYLFLLPRLENCLVDFRLKLGSAAPPVPLPCPRFRPARKQLRRGLHFQTCAALTWSVASSWLCIYFFAFWFIRPSRWSFPLEARGRRPSSSSSSCRSSSLLVGPAKHEGPIKAIQSSWTCSSLVSLLGLLPSFLARFWRRRASLFFPPAGGSFVTPIRAPGQNVCCQQTWHLRSSSRNSRPLEGSGDQAPPCAKRQTFCPRLHCTFRHAQPICLANVHGHLARLRRCSRYGITNSNSPVAMRLWDAGLTLLCSIDKVVALLVALPSSPVVFHYH